MLVKGGHGCWVHTDQLTIFSAGLGNGAMPIFLWYEVQQPMTNVREARKLVSHQGTRSLGSYGRDAQWPLLQNVKLQVEIFGAIQYRIYSQNLLHNTWLYHIQIPEVIAFYAFSRDEKWNTFGIRMLTVLMISRHSADYKARNFTWVFIYCRLSDINKSSSRSRSILRHVETSHWTPPSALYVACAAIRVQFNRCMNHRNIMAGNLPLLCDANGEVD